MAGLRDPFSNELGFMFHPVELGFININLYHSASLL